MDKVIEINTLILNRRREKNCKCEKPSYEIDVNNHLVYCQKCMAVIEPFVALLNIASHFEDIREEILNAERYKAELMSYKPYVREAKRYERMMRDKDMLPLCPHCHTPFEWSDVTGMINKKYKVKNEEG